MVKHLWQVVILLSVLLAPRLVNARVLIDASSCGRQCVLYGISIFGTIEQQTVAEFARAAADPDVLKSQKMIGPFVRLNSPGGSVPDAMAIGEMIRKAGFFTEVLENDDCSSACVLVLAAGVKRIVAGHIGIHRPHFDESLFARLSEEEARKKYEQMAEGVRQYLAKMGMSDGLYNAMLRVPSDSLEDLSIAEIKSFGLEGEDPAWAEWDRARLIQSEGKEQYEVNQLFFKLVEACSNRPGRDPDKCDSEIRPQFQRQLEACTNRSTDDYIECARVIQRRMMSRYQ